ncbi:TonB-dependent receptor plug domain-containing protein [Maribellus comscasis]|uniref:TonB-dependent receptor plug domain-containing protein n=1 Tax=Maribellus comscasis TaxID=2681766 RepID=A0A6I6K2W8_9BACT|nr:TonB-dependent receptor [Maribellus comscasis]QGY46782.1 TonB-dependent receptor plug domain-containing protein [Maribellus comscasis]
MKVRIFCILILFLKPLLCSTQNNDNTGYIYNYSLRELANIKILTGSIKAEKTSSAPSNIIIITKQMIEERGYQTLVDICQDVPGFDFMMYNDGSGEYSTYSMNRGVGEIGNPEVLIMVDGIIQNQISYNWSLLWTYENMFADIERIEIIQGPGSVMYGAQAFTGIIHFITKKKFSGINAQSSVGSNRTSVFDVHMGTPIGENTHASLAIHKYKSLGDEGIDRYDPGGYFKNNKYPSTILADYDSEGNFVEDVPNALAGKEIPGGFSTGNDSYAFRAKISHKNNEAGFFYSEFDRGYSSANVQYEYNIFSKKSKTHYKSYHLYITNNSTFSKKLNLKSDLVFRSTNILPDAGFRYLYQFPELTKNYASYSYQGYLEEKLLYEFSPQDLFYFGLKATVSRKSERIVSLGDYSDSNDTSVSSWDIAEEGGGLNQKKIYPLFYEKELAFYALYDKEWGNKLSSSLGLRYDYSTEFGSILNPRLAIDFQPETFMGIKFMYGTAFRQPGIFELTSEFRGNPELNPEKIKTGEVEFSGLLANDKISIKANVFYSVISDFIGKVPDENMPSGERYENLDQVKVSGVSTFFSSQITQYLLLYSNYSYLVGIKPSGVYEIERTAKNKLNAGVNLKLFSNKVTADFRANYVGKRKAQETNQWLQTYENGFAPSYLKANLVVSYRFLQSFTAQLIANNVFDEQYYGVGRETGSGFVDDYDYQNNVNPDGLIPAYHPQPGRTFLVSLLIKLHQ